jgi:DNA-binding MarR family transcriptional regulator
VDSPERVKRSSPSRQRLAHDAHAILQGEWKDRPPRVVGNAHWRQLGLVLTEKGLMNPTVAHDSKDFADAWRRPAPALRPSARARQQWREARVFQRKAQRLFKEPKATFVEWLLLETLQELIEERGDAVSQADVARRSGLSERVVSRWMRLMGDLGFVDRGPDADGRAWRVLLTELGDRMVRACNERLEAGGLTG